MYVQELNGALRELLERDERVVVLGEDIADPYGGAFKVTRGLTTAFPERVLTTPVSEGAIVGLAGGLALEGYRPIVEIMFGDFLTLTFDQVVNQLTKYGAMYDGKVTCPVIIRTPSGGHRGYGPTHSQSLEKHFLGVPNLRVVAVSPFHHPAAMYEALLRQDDPVLVIEHKLLYGEKLRVPSGGRSGDALARVEQSEGCLPTVLLSQVPTDDCTASVLAYGYQALLAAQAVEELAIEEEVFAELVVPEQISPVDWEPIETSARRTGSLVTIEEGTAGWSWGTEAASEMSRRLFGELRHPVRVVASERSIIPSSRRLEQDVLVGLDTIKRAIREAAS